MVFFSFFNSKNVTVQCFCFCIFAFCAFIALFNIFVTFKALNVWGGSVEERVTVCHEAKNRECRFTP